jgi:hypothetical protein
MPEKIRGWRDQISFVPAEDIRMIENQATSNADDQQNGNDRQYQDLAHLELNEWSSPENTCACPFGER